MFTEEDVKESLEEVGIKLVPQSEEGKVKITSEDGETECLDEDFSMFENPGICEKEKTVQSFYIYEKKKNGNSYEVYEDDSIPSEYKYIARYFIERTHRGDIFAYRTFSEAVWRVLSEMRMQLDFEGDFEDFCKKEHPNILPSLYEILGRKLGYDKD